MSSNCPGTKLVGALLFPKATALRGDCCCRPPPFSRPLPPPLPPFPPLPPLAPLLPPLSGALKDAGPPPYRRLKRSKGNTSNHVSCIAIISSSFLMKGWSSEKRHLCSELTFLDRPSCPTLASRYARNALLLPRPRPRPASPPPPARPRPRPDAPLTLWLLPPPPSPLLVAVARKRRHDGDAVLLVIRTA
jgi:hypothetical protein